MLKHTILILCFFIGILVHSQSPTIGLLWHDNNASDGYTLFSPENNQSVYLINNCGEKINEWTFTEKPGLTCYLLENGTLLRAGRDNLEIRDWDDNIVWTYATNVNGILQHHDIEPLPNGNILCLLTDTYTDIEMVAQGKDPLTVATQFKLDKLIELQPVGDNDANIVWEWKFIDHFIQDFNSTKPNFGVVIDHPELLDLNYIDTNINNQGSDYTHVNGIDYNSKHDQIILSARHLSEIYIIDHSTTTIEAAGHTGGNSNMGGDFLWRWGNPQVYKQGTIADQKLFLQHDSKWVETGYSDEGKITVFNNGGDGSNTFSSINLITPEIINNLYTKEANKFNPQDFEWSWNGSILGNVVLESKKSGANSLPNGNFLICETSLGQVSEITKAGEHLWTYKNPTGVNIFNQFDDIMLNANRIFRAEKYPVNFIGFIGKDLTPNGIIENENSNSSNCTLLSTNKSEIYNLKIINPIKNNLLKFNKTIELDIISIIDLNGRIVLETKNFNNDRLIVNVKAGFYIIELNMNGAVTRKKIIIN